MEYVELVNKIVTAEHNAKGIVQEARQKQLTLESDVAREAALLRESFLERARRRVELVEKTEQEAAEQDIARWDERLKESMAGVNGAYEQNRERWVNKLFSMIVGVEL